MSSTTNAAGNFVTQSECKHVMVAPHLLVFSGIRSSISEYICLPHISRLKLMVGCLPMAGAGSTQHARLRRTGPTPYFDGLLAVGRRFRCRLGDIGHVEARQQHVTAVDGQFLAGHVLRLV